MGSGKPQNLGQQIDWLDQWYRSKNKLPGKIENTCLGLEQIWIMRDHQLRPGVMDATSKLAKSD